MATFNLSYYDNTNENVYSDGPIEKELYEFVTKDFNDWYSDGRWEIIYHMSHLRENILNWYPFKENAVILEVGAGCGALTGMLCQRAKKVVAVELTKSRAAINYERNKDKDNLEIVVADINKIPDEWKFDYIIINGVFEYASYMISSDNPYVDFLKKLSKHLTLKGRILLAIENRLGIKYLSGAVEDHTGKFFSGINGYTDNEKVRTFSKKELKHLITSADMNILKFYYPYPDYKFPTEIFTDYTVNEKIPITRDIPLDTTRVKLYNESMLYLSLIKEKSMDLFSNSFLVEISNTADIDINNFGYIKVSANRKKEFRICTIIDQNKKEVYKYNLCKEGKQHIANMIRFSDYELVGLKNVPVKNVFSYAYLPLESLEYRLLLNIKEDNKSEFLRLICLLRDKLYNNNPMIIIDDTKEFKYIFGEDECNYKLRWVMNANVDLIAANIFINEKEEYEIIDYEWHIPCKVPMEFVFWRMLNQFISENNLHSYCDINEQKKLIGINDEVIDCFKKWDNYFIKEYVGYIELSKLEKDIIPINLMDIVNKIKKESIILSTIFWDLGNGYKEDQHITERAKYEDDGLKIVFKSEVFSKAKYLRWDPLEGVSTIIKIDYIKTDGNDIKIIPINADKIINENEYKFYNFDPQFLIEGYYDGMSFIEIGYHCSVIDWTEGYLKKEKDLIECINKNKRMMEERIKYNEEKKILLNEKKIDTEDILVLNKEVSNLRDQKTSLIKENILLNEQLNNIYSSRGWKLINKLYKIKSLVTNKN